MRLFNKLVSHVASQLGLGGPMVINTHLDHVGEATKGESKGQKMTSWLAL